MESLTESQLAQKVYWEDVFGLMEEQEECWKQMYRIFQRLTHQDADPRLLQQVTVTINYMAEAFKALEPLEPCFQQAPKSLPILTTNPPIRY